MSVAGLLASLMLGWPRPGRTVDLRMAIDPVHQDRGVVWLRPRTR